jgi:hypothetical protein
VRQLASSRTISDAQRVGSCGLLAQKVCNAEVFKDAGAVGSDLDAGALFGKRGATLEYVRSDTALGERNCRGEAADAASRDRDVESVGGHHLRRI